MTFIAPIYYTHEYRTKPSKTILIGMNHYRNAHFSMQTAIKHFVEGALLPQFTNVGMVLGPYRIHYKLYYKNPISDGSNIVALTEKCFLDSLQGILTRSDTVLHHLGSSWEVAGQDIENPRVEINILPA